jgi:hypothetical protein
LEGKRYSTQSRKERKGSQSFLDENESNGGIILIKNKHFLIYSPKPILITLLVLCGPLRSLRL